MTQVVDGSESVNVAFNIDDQISCIYIFIEIAFDEPVPLVAVHFSMKKQ